MRLECRHVKTLFPKTDADKERTDFVIAVYRYKGAADVWEEIVAKGSGLPVDHNLEISLVGDVVTDDYGTSFKVKSYTTQVIKTRASVIGYLGSGAIKGVGKEIAKRIVDHFDVDAIEILQNDPERLLEVSGIGPAVLEEIKSSFYENREIHGLMQYLGQFNISVNKCKRIVDTFGDRALEVVTQDLYHLCQVTGFGFLTVDAMAEKMQHDMKTYPRVLAGAEYLLDENRVSGHLYMKPDKFIQALLKMLNNGRKPEDSFELFELFPLARQAMEQSKNITVDNACVYLTQDYANEKRFAQLMAERLVAEQLSEKGKTPYLAVTGKGIQLSQEQAEAVATALHHDTAIISGGPGTGKTTVLKTFLERYLAMFPMKNRILLCAPTGRAARRMSEATGYDAFTIHRAFQLGGEGEAIREQKKSFDVVVVDEFSMSDQWVSTAMLSMLAPETKLIFVGDAQQLPSVGPGSVLNEMINSGKIPTVHLKKVFRQAAGSSIAENAFKISNAKPEILMQRRDGSFVKKFLIFDDDCIFMPAETQEEAMDYVCQLYERAARALGPEKVQILTPLRKKGACCVDNLNAAIQRIVRGDPEMGFKAGKDQYFCVGDPVIQLKNVNGVNNGDLGIVTDVSDGVVVEYPGVEAPRVYKGDNLRIIQLAFALTVHKSQGSEYPLVIAPVLRSHSFFLNKNLLYTALTRGKRRVVIIGDEYTLRKSALKIATARNTNLAKRIAAIYDKLMEEKVCEKENLAVSA